MGCTQTTVIQEEPVQMQHQLMGPTTQQLLQPPSIQAAGVHTSAEVQQDS